jgi:hypothetical protein
MSNELYFIPRIAAALRGPDTFASLAEAIAEIVRLGRLPGYAEGFDQFRAFMATVVEGTRSAQLDALEDAMAGTMMIEALADTVHGDTVDPRDAVELVCSRPDWTAKLKRIARAWDAARALAWRPVLSLAHDGRIFTTLVFDETTLAHSVIALQPGLYSLSLHTGRLLWEGMLAESELRWTTAFPHRPFDLAAATFEQGNQPSRTTSLLDGEIILRVFPGLEHGRLEIKVSREGSHSP